jgi:sensor histidine kinase YesM
MTFTFDMNSDDFMLPALSIQPIVENAIKHGLMPLDRGGSVRVASWETPSAYCVSIEDDGVGFDTSILLDERKHIGLRNIRERLEATVGGSLTIESAIGKGTKVQLSIPKENRQ